MTPANGWTVDNLKEQADARAAELAAAEARAAEVALETAADKLAARLELQNERKAIADDRRERREFWKTVILATVVGLPAIIGAGAGIIGIQRTDATHQLVNSRMTELTEEVRKSSRAEGVLEGKAGRDKASKDGSK